MGFKMKSKPQVDYVSTAIVYPNSRIHVGWAWECLGADWLVRGLKGLGRRTFFSTGTDEHSINVQKAAQSQGLSPKEYCDRMAQDIEKVLRNLHISYDRFARTSDLDHQRVVEAVVKKAYQKGDIYQAKYEGLYCESCEAYYTQKDLKEGLCPSHGKPPQWISEENYFFRLSQYQDRLLQLFQDHPDFLQPEFRRSEVINFIQSGLKDFSISRSTFDWGIPLPFDSNHVVYVWFDALVHYLTAAGLDLKLNASGQFDSQVFDERWPPHVHIIGKDITRFHCIYWPAMLMALDLPLPHRVFAHGYITIKGQKLSKSLGNGITPDEVTAVTGVDPFRYYLLAENQFAQDGNFDWEALIFKSNADLANDWGNLVNRSISMTRKYFPDQSLSWTGRVTHSAQIQASFEELLKELAHTLDQINPSAYAAACCARSRLLNLYIDQTKPWVLAKKGTPEAFKELQEVLYTLLEGIRWLAVFWRPILPVGMPDVFRQLGLDCPAEQGAFQSLKWGEISFRPNEPKPIYPRLEIQNQESEVRKD